MEYKLLPNIKESSDIKDLSRIELLRLANEIRTKIIDTVSKNGGHLASNLGIVELTIALHLAFDFPKDQLVFDVSHQSYTHKLLAGQFDSFHTLRTFKGLSGYCKISESEYDVFGAGHASTSISAALGIRTAKDLKNDDSNVIALIGDGALSGGMALEALNSVGHMQKKMIIVLNDNEQSISKNVGALSSLLNNMRTSKKYIKIKDDLNDKLPQIPIIGTSIRDFIAKSKNMIKQGVVEGMFFEELGITYIGLLDGHNIPQMVQIFEAVKELSTPVIIHTVSKKGKGYIPAIKNPEIYHGVGSFDPTIGIENKESSSISFSEVFGNKMIDLGKKDDSVLAITAAMDIGTKLTSFKETYPKRFFDMGIAEEHSMTFAAGLAKEGLKPYFAVYSTFLQRAYDQLIHDVSLQNLPVRICIDRCGIVGEDGATHHGIFDMPVLLSIPNLELLSPASKEDLELCLDYSLDVNNPLCIRYPRAKAPSFDIEASLEPISNHDNARVVIVSFGVFYPLAIEIKDELSSMGIDAKLIKLTRLKPLNIEKVLEYIADAELIVTIEDSQKIGGFGSYLRTMIEEHNKRFEYLSFAYPDKFIEQGTIAELNLDMGFEAEKMAIEIKESLNE